MFGREGEANVKWNLARVVSGCAVVQGRFAAALESTFAQLSGKARLLKRLRAAWAAPGDQDGWLASRYFELRSGEKTRTHVDDQTWTDLEFPAIFRMMNTAVSAIGAQCLFARLRTYVDDPQEREDAYLTYQALAAESQLRESIQVRLAPLQADSTPLVIELLLGQASDGLKHPGRVRAWSVACVLILIAAAAQLAPAGLVIALLVVNAVVILAWTRTYREAEALRLCKTLLHVADHLGTLQHPRAPQQIRSLAADRRRRAALHGALRLHALSWRLPLITNALNFLFLWEMVVFSFTLASVRARRADFVRVFELVGSLDATICIASFLAQPRMQVHCLPTVTSEPLIDLMDGYHPLLAEPVANSLRLQRRSVLVSGSNMAGKTTFIKMIGTNIILGRTLGVCLAARATLPLANVLANIRAEHSIASGKSRYFAETERVLSFIQSAREEAPQVLLLDELFSGTNTRERVAGAYAVLKALAERSLVLATTHDVELHALLAEGFDMLSFVEDPDTPGYFDYRVRRGASAVGNAIRLLAKLGFPGAVVEDALAALAGAKGSAHATPVVPGAS